MRSSFFMASLPLFLQILAWALPLATGAAFPVIYGIRSMLQTETNRARRLLQVEMKGRGRKGRFPGTDIEIADINIVPDSEIHKAQREVNALRREAASRELDLSRIRRRYTDTGARNAKKWENTRSRLEGVLEDFKAVDQVIGESAAKKDPAGENERGTAVRGNGAAATGSARRPPPMKGRGARVRGGAGVPRRPSDRNGGRGR